ENSYIETLWWILKRLWEKKLLYKGNKVVPWCTRCGTALSSHELAQGYKEVADKSVYLKFKIKPNVYILSWTTTPWTLPGNIALAVGSRIDYVRVKSGKDFFILAKKRLTVLSEHYEIVEEFKGQKLVGLKYEPLFKIPSLQSKNSYKIYPADFVTTDEGTGVVHTAVMYGEDDYALGKKVGLPEHHTVNERGKFTSEVPAGLAGMYVKAKETDEKILNYLKANSYFLKAENYLHEYPFCWRCDSPVIYYARDSWFIAMSKLRKELLKGNEKMNWVPEYIKNGRFGEWLREAKDWNLSRERYWGTPLPIWECKNCGETKVVGSFEELSDAQGEPRNRYLFMRHGEAVCNLKKVINSDPKFKDKYPLTLRGRKAVEKTVAELKKEKIDLVVASDFRRARETAGIVAQGLGIKKVLYHKHFREIFTGVRDGKPSREYSDFFKSREEKFEKAHPGGETLRVLGKRVFNGILDLEKKYDGKVILIVSHEYPIWMAETTIRGWSEEQSLEEKEICGGDFIKPAEWRETSMLNLPRNEFNFADPHRPFVDEIVFKCPSTRLKTGKKCGGKMKRVKEVADVWFDSGAMPFAQGHWPFDSAQDKSFAQNQKSKTCPERSRGIKNKNLGIDYPADYIAEAIDQTRGWFYTLLAVATALGDEAPNKNVI
ncbi:MAG: class I tRNA ligase family protein, partial [Patescibacteria group bacterium]